MNKEKLEEILLDNLDEAIHYLQFEVLALEKFNLDLSDVTCPKPK